MTVQSEHTTTARSFKHLSLSERGAIFALLHEKRSTRYIARQLKRSLSTVCREIQRSTAAHFSNRPHSLSRCRRWLLSKSAAMATGIVGLTREEFGHWEIDTVVGRRSNDEGLLTLTECKTRQELVIWLAHKDSESVQTAMKELKQRVGSSFAKVFRSITADNGSEFADLSTLLAPWNCQVYFSHPYSSWECGTNERHNGLIRRFIPKAKSIRNVSNAFIRKTQDWCNLLPRKILDYKTPQECFLEDTVKNPLPHMIFRFLMSVAF